MGGTYTRRIVGEPLELDAPPGTDPFTAVLSRIDVYRSEGARPVVHFIMDVDYETYVSMDESGAYGFCLESIDAATANASFTNELNVELTLRLADELLPDDAAAITDRALTETLLAYLQDAPTRFVSPTAFRWLTVMQLQGRGSNVMRGLKSRYPPR